jgi:hypothetical protein
MPAGFLALYNKDSKLSWQPRYVTAAGLHVAAIIFAENLQNVPAHGVHYTAGNSVNQIQASALPLPPFLPQSSCLYTSLSHILLPLVPSCPPPPTAGYLDLPTLLVIFT